MQTNITLTNDRGANLAGTLFTPDQQTSSQITNAIMIAPATGIKHQFYTGFAEYLCGQGFGVISFSNEGICDSLEGNLKDCTASLITWGRSDMFAGLERLKSEFPNAKYHLVGHSAGGQLFGLMDNHLDLTSVFNVACSSGQIANMRLSHKAKAMWFMDCFIPASNLLFGYARNDVVGMGEPLPKLVAKNWRDWCNGAGYIATAFGTDVTKHYYNEVTLPAMWINAPDDDIANDKNVADMMRVFPNMQGQTKTLIPSDYGLKEIGHMKFFSRKSNMLWTLATEWIKEHG